MSAISFPQCDRNRAGRLSATTQTPWKRQLVLSVVILQKYDRVGGFSFFWWSPLSLPEIPESPRYMLSPSPVWLWQAAHASKTYIQPAIGASTSSAEFTGNLAPPPSQKKKISNHIKIEMCVRAKSHLQSRGRFCLFSLDLHLENKSSRPQKMKKLEYIWTVLQDQSVAHPPITNHVHP